MDKTHAARTRRLLEDRAADLERTNAELERGNSDLERANARLTRSNADLETYATNTSHDLSEPLRAITNALELVDLEYGGVLPDGVRGHVRRALASAASLRGLIAAALAEAQMEQAEDDAADVDRPAPETVSLTDAADVLGVSVSTVRRWVDGGRLACTRTPGGHRRVSLDDLRRMAREVRGPARLRVAEMPTRPLPAAASAIEALRPVLLDKAGVALYDDPGAAWFAESQAATTVDAWLQTLAASCAAGRYGDAVAEGHRVLRHARLAGATLLECHLFLEVCGALTARRLQRGEAEVRGEAADLQRLLRAVAHGFEANA